MCTKNNLYQTVEPWAAVIKTFLQMVIGFVLVILIGAKLYMLICPPKTDLWCSFATLHPLEITGYALAISASVELAYMLFTPGPDEAIDPLILGLSAATLIEISKPENTKFEVIALIIVLLAGIGFLFWLKERFKLKEKDAQPINPPDATR